MSINVLSLFDGISCGRLALERAGIPYLTYFASEIDHDARVVAQKNFPDTVQVGDVTKLPSDFYSNSVDLLLAGSPCQGFSVSGDQLNFDDPRSKLFWEFVRILKASNPRYFLLENVRMHKDHQRTISNELGVEPVLINSSLVSAQSRERLYWTNIPNVTIPENRHLKIKDILEDDSDWISMDDKILLPAAGRIEKDSVILDSYIRHAHLPIPKTRSGWNHQGNRVYSIEGKSPCLMADGGGLASSANFFLRIGDKIRKPTIGEAEKLQTLPIGYTEGIAPRQRRSVIGNGWTVDVISHILRNI